MSQWKAQSWECGAKAHPMLDFCSSIRLYFVESEHNVEHIRFPTTTLKSVNMQLFMGLWSVWNNIDFKQLIEHF